jgi:hypothetical protein
MMKTIDDEQNESKVQYKKDEKKIAVHVFDDLYDS